MRSTAIALVNAISLFRIFPASRVVVSSFTIIPHRQFQLQSTSAFNWAVSTGHHSHNSSFLTRTGACPILLQSSSSQHSSTSPSPRTSTKLTPTMPLTHATLSAQNATTTNAIIDHYSSSDAPNSKAFLALSKYEGDGILQRDDEDASKLQKGIDLAKEKGVLDPNFVPEEYIKVDVLGKSPEDVADEILGRVRKGGEGGSGGGGVVVLCGLSGTGKGTTVATLKEKLEKEDKKQVVCWSNGNIFRSVTLLAVTWCEQQSDCDGFVPEKALTKENLESFVGMLEFGKFNGKFDTKITGLGLDMLVSEVQNTELKSPKVSKNIPTVAEVTQGEVVLFASNAVRQMGEDGIFVLLEGREQTVNYVRTPLRFTLTLSDMSLIGKRRAAQRLAAAALGEVNEGVGEEQITKALDEQLAKMSKEAELDSSSGWLEYLTGGCLKSK